MSFYKHSLLVGIAFIVFFSCRNGTQANVRSHIMLASLAAPTEDSTPEIEAPLFHRLDSFFARRNKLGGFNGNVLIVKGGRILYKGCFGYCNIAT